MSIATMLNLICKLIGHNESEADTETLTWLLFVSNLFFEMYVSFKIGAVQTDIRARTGDSVVC